MSIPGPTADDKPLVASGPPNPLPAGTPLTTDANKWYRLKASYINDKGKAVTGYAYPVGTNASESFWDYVIFREGGPGAGALQFNLIPKDGGWFYWKIRDTPANAGYHLDCKATGWLYRASAYNTWFRIVDGKLYCSYWKGPVGSTYRSFLVSSGQYLGMDLPAFTCELEEVV